MDQTEKFWDRIAPRYSRRPISDEAAYLKKLDITREYLNPDSTVLELGCGTGSTAIAHAPYVKHIHAIDISSKMIEIALDKARDRNIENVTFEKSSIDELAIPDQSVDAVLALSVLHLLENRGDVIKKINRLLKPGGVFISSTFCIGNSSVLFKIILPIGKFLRLMPTVKLFNKEELLADLSHAGFSIDHLWQPDKGKSIFLVAKKSHD